MILNTDLAPEYLIKRIPFLKTFENRSTPKTAAFQKITFNSNVKIDIGDESYVFPHWNIAIQCDYMREQINDNFRFTFTIEPEIIVTKPKNMNPLLFTVLNIVLKKNQKTLTLNKDIMSKQEHLTKEQLDDIINDANKIFFMIEEQHLSAPEAIKSPLDEKVIKQKINILENLRNLPQNFDAEFNQTGSGKSIHGKPNLPNASAMQIAKMKARITQAHQIAKTYREAYQKNLNTFNVMWQGTEYTCKIPDGFREKTNPAGQKTDYLYYFDYPNIGDGGFQIAMDKTGFMKAKHIRSKADMNQTPNLAAATDAGYQKDYEGRTKYFFVQAGVKGKFQENGYSVFPSPAMDAAVKTLISFQTDIIDFISGNLGYTSDAKGKDLANNMNLEDKIKKVRLDAEQILKTDKSLAFNPVWTAFRENLLKKYNSEKSIFNFDINSEVDAFVETFKNKNPFNNQKPKIGLPQDEIDAWEKEQKEKLARLIAARARKH